ncbi:InlB B-repeat-containing protein [Sphaerochaeta globosa]|uniref:Cell wall/surface repeat protein n=1 Tax=Sphaerochaeta globosa (strain ATCC BAA-1886 / DSM 22777 / Buddy) TaxID=158189 RepID=F0RZA8_SPHGB|nr:InlB B-repeat-containing protein [Sphaerochaeta globosa]ADY13389.1 cell wall/surface repeat protein [Sphaerochaeta globosa str. Buddy]
MKAGKLVVCIGLLLVVFTGCSDMINELANRQVTVTFDDQGADSNVYPASKNVLRTAGTDTVGSLPTPPGKRGDTFGGWYTQVNGGRTAFDASTPLTEDITVYANWIPDYVPGDTGPAGGIVFYDKGTYQDEWRFLEAAPSDITSEFDTTRPYIHFYGLYRSTPGGANLAVGTGTAIGTGKANTEALVNAMGTSAYYISDYDPMVYSPTEHYAARACSLYANGGYTDWFLPSKDELNVMYENLYHIEVPIGGLTDSYYWSSSELENSSFYAMLQFFTNGMQSMNPRDGMYRVRPARAF